METVTDNYGDFKLIGLKEINQKFQVEIRVADSLVKSLVIDFIASMNLGTIII